MSKLHDNIDAGHTTTEYQETVVDPNIGEPSQVQCANCGAWRLNSRLYCPMCGARNVQSTSVFLTEEEIVAKAGKTSTEELRATVSEPQKEKQSRRRLWIILSFSALLIGGLIWAHQAREGAVQAKQLAEQQAAEAKAKADAQAKENRLAADKAREAASAAQSSDTAAVDNPFAKASEPAILTDDQATKLGMNTPPPKPKKVEPAPVVVATPAPAPVAAAPEPTPEPAKPEPAPVVEAPPPPKVETPLERLQSALAACKGRGGFFERNACEFNARKQFCVGLEGTTRDCPIQRTDL